MNKIFTVSEISRIINVSRFSVLKWIKEGKIKSLQLPGGNYRVTRENLVDFMRAYKIPVSYLNSGENKKVLMVNGHSKGFNSLMTKLNKEPAIEVKTALGWFRAGMALLEFKPHLIIIDADFEDVELRKVCKLIKTHPELNETKIVGILREYAGKIKRGSCEYGFDELFEKPFTNKDIINKVKDILSI